MQELINVKPLSCFPNHALWHLQQIAVLKACNQQSIQPFSWEGYPREPRLVSRKLLYPSSYVGHIESARKDVWDLLLCIYNRYSDWSMF